jgi:hypothetical protein
MKQNIEGKAPGGSDGDVNLGYIKQSDAIVP